MLFVVFIVSEACTVGVYDSLLPLMLRGHRSEILLYIPGIPKTSLVAYRAKDDSGHSRRFPSFTDDSTLLSFLSAPSRGLSRFLNQFDKWRLHIHWKWSSSGDVQGKGIIRQGAQEPNYAGFCAACFRNRHISWWIHIFFESMSRRTLIIIEQHTFSTELLRSFFLKGPR